MCTALVVGNMIGSGVFLLPATLAPYGGISVLGWGVSAAGAACLALVFARLGGMLPRTGGPYAFVREGFGDFAGFLTAWSYWISICAANAALAVAFASYLTVFFPALGTTPGLGAAVALAAIWTLFAVNVSGVRNAGWVQLGSTILKLAPLLAIIAVGLFFFEPAHFRPFNASGQAALPAVSATVTLTLWAFQGLESGTVPADEVQDPERTIPRATLVGTAIATVVYILGTVVVMGLVEPRALALSTAPFADAARTIAGPAGAYALAGGAAISCFGALNGWILLSGQLPLAAAGDGMLPASLARLSRRATPATALLVSTLVASALVALNYTRGLVGAFTFIILLSTLATLVPYLFCSMAVLVVRASPGTSSGTGGAMGALAALAFLYSLWAIAGSGQEAVFWGFLLLMGGIPIHVALVRAAAARRSAPPPSQPTPQLPLHR